MPTLTSSIQHGIRSPSHINQTRNQMYPDLKGKGICRLCDTVYRKMCRTKLLELKQKISKVIGYIFNINKLVSSFYINNKRSERECKKNNF